MWIDDQILVNAKQDLYLNLWRPKDTCVVMGSGNNQDTETYLERCVKDQIPVHDILGRFIRDILPLKEHVEKREETFFLNNTLLYTGGNISDDKINHFQELWQSDKLDADDRETIWTWMECFIKISDCYFKKYGYINGWEKIE